MKCALPIVSTLIALAAHAETIPADWTAFKTSPDANDKKIVSSIERTAEKRWFDLCTEWGRAARAAKETRRSRAVFEYLLHAKHINAQDTGNVKSGDVKVGMTVCGAMAVMGNPTRLHARESRLGQSLQLVYERASHYATYIHAEITGNGLLVTSISR